MDTLRRTREAIVDGIFYPSDGLELRERIEGYLAGAGQKRHDARTIVTPHAAYDLCGRSMAAGFSAASERAVDTVIVLAPVHREPADEIFLTESGSYLTPVGPIPVDIALTNELESCSTRIIRNDIPHLEEHAIEVQLPFVQILFPNARVVPILLGRTSHANTQVLARALQTVLQDETATCLFVVSSNLCADCTAEEAETQIALFTRLLGDEDSEGLVDAYEAGRITACGAGCAAAVLMTGLVPGEPQVLLREESPPNRDDDPEQSTHYGAVASFPTQDTP